MKKAAKATAFILIAALIFSGLNNLLTRKSLYGWWNITTKINGFFNSPKDKYDVVFVGSSHAYCSFNPLIIWSETELDSYVLATQKQPLWASYYYIKEAISRQKPQLIVLDCYTASKDDEYTDDATNYTFCDDFPFGINKLRLVHDSAGPGKRFDLLVRFTKYHSRWSELTSDDFGYNPKKLSDWLNGYCMLTATKPDAAKPYVGSAEVKIPLSDKNRDALLRIINLCRETGTALMVVKTPSGETAAEKGYYESVGEICRENEVEFIDYNELYKTIGLESEKDFFDDAHLNMRGAQKFSEYFAKTQLISLSPKHACDYSERLRRFWREYEGITNPFYQKPYFA